MKFSLLSVFFIIPIYIFSQNLQLHYDLRHTFYPELNPGNFPTFNFEYFRNIDTSGTGSFFLKLQANLNGKNNNVSQAFTQISQSLKFWKPKIYLSVNYSGGLGVTSNSYGYYISNSFGIGISYPFQWKGAWIATNLSFRYNAFDKPSYDPQFTFYFGRGFLNYKIFYSRQFCLLDTKQEPGKCLY